jgi:hypothetical protein
MHVVIDITKDIGRAAYCWRTGCLIDRLTSLCTLNCLDFGLNLTDMLETLIFFTFIVRK